MVSHNLLINFFGLALFAYALTRVPDKYRPAWTRQLNSWRKLIGLIAVVAAILILLNPEFYALGILGDSAFFDLLVLAITCQLQIFGARIWSGLRTAFSRVKAFTVWRVQVNCVILICLFVGVVTPIQKIIHRLSS